MLAQVADVIETVGLEHGGIGCDLGKGGLGQNILGDVVDRAVNDLMNEADVAILAGGDARDHLSSRNFRIDNGFATAAPMVDHHDEILHPAPAASAKSDSIRRASISENQNTVKLEFRKSEIDSCSF